MGAFKILVNCSMAFALVLVSSLFAHGTYTGYSGAPGSNGTCASSCHGASGGTMTATGFPASYTPGAGYTVTIGRSDTATIVNFNASCRVGTSSTVAGTITAGTNTSVYSVTAETNGVHFTAVGKTGGTFSWQAPAKGTGAVKLYVAGLETNHNGRNTALVLSSSEATSAIVPVSASKSTTLFLRLSGSNKGEIMLPSSIIPSEIAMFKVFTIRGDAIDVRVSGTTTALIWDGTDRAGHRLAPGAYLYLIKQGDIKITGRMILSR